MSDMIITRITGCSGMRPRGLYEQCRDAFEAGAPFYDTATYWLGLTLNIAAFAVVVFYIGALIWLISDLNGRDDISSRTKAGYILGVLLFPWVLLPLYLVNVPAKEGVA